VGNRYASDLAIHDGTADGDNIGNSPPPMKKKRAPNEAFFIWRICVLNFLEKAYSYGTLNR